MRGQNNHKGSILVQKKYSVSLLVLLLCCIFIDHGQASPFHRNRRPPGRRPPPPPLPATGMMVPMQVWKTADPVSSSSSAQENRQIPLNWGDDPSDPKLPQFNPIQEPLSPPQSEIQNGDNTWTNDPDLGSISWTEQAPPPLPPASSSSEQKMDINFNSWSNDEPAPIDVDLGGLLGPFDAVKKKEGEGGQMDIHTNNDWNDKAANQNQAGQMTMDINTNSWNDPLANQRRQDQGQMTMDINTNSWNDPLANQGQSQMTMDTTVNNWSDALANQRRQDQGQMTMDINTNSWNDPLANQGQSQMTMDTTVNNWSDALANQMTMDMSTKLWTNDLPAKNFPPISLNHQIQTPNKWRRRDQISRGPSRPPIRRMKNKSSKVKGRRPLPPPPVPRGPPPVPASTSYHDDSYMPKPVDNNSWLTYSTIPSGRPAFKQTQTPVATETQTNHRIESNLMLPPPGGKMRDDTVTWLKDTAATDSMTTVTKSTTHNHHHHHYHYIMPKAGSGSGSSTSTSANRKPERKKIVEIESILPPKENGGNTDVNADADSVAEGGGHFFDIEDIFENAAHLPGPTPPPVYTTQGSGDDDDTSVHFEVPILPTAVSPMSTTPPPIFYDKNANLMDNILFRDDIEAKLNRMANWQKTEKMKQMAMAMAVNMEEGPEIVQSEGLEIDEDVALEETTTTTEKPEVEPLIKINLSKAVNNFSKVCAYWMPNIMNFGQSFCNSKKQQEEETTIQTNLN